MALKYPDRLESNNPKAYGIVKAIEISGHKTVNDLASLYSIADCILSDSKNNLNNDAIGQEWYVIDQNAYYRLVSWENRKNKNGWAKREGSSTEHIDEIQNNLNSHISRTDNPHKVNKTQVGLSNVTNDTQVKRAEMGVANGVATLDEQGLIPSSQLPSYVDDVLEFQEKSSFPKPGESNKIYVELKTNLTYRWSGTQYVEISPSIGLGETSSTAYAGDKGKDLANKVNNKVDKVTGKDLSTNDFTNELKQTLEDLNSWNYIGILSSWTGISKLTTTSTESEILAALTITPLRGNKISDKAGLFRVLDQCAINKKFLKESSTNATVFVDYIGNCYVIQIIGNRAAASNGRIVGTPVIRHITISGLSNEDLKVLKNPFEIKLEDLKNQLIIE